jgi:hypothetical protein
MATQSQLLEAFTDGLYDALVNGGYKVTNEDGSISRLPVEASFLNVVRQFLKDYPTERKPVSTEQFMADYGDLPFFQEPKKPLRRDKRASSAAS